MSRYELWYATQNGVKLEMLDRVISFEYVIIDGDVGYISLMLPNDEERFYVQAVQDRNVQIFRAPVGGEMGLETVGFARKWSRSTSSDGLQTLTLGAPDVKDLTTRRIVGYQENATYGQFASQPADDIMYDIATTNLGGGGRNATETNRIAAKNLGGFTLLPSQGDGPVISAKLAWKELRKALQDLQNMSKAAGTEVFWTIEPLGTDLFAFKVKTEQPGTNRTVGTGINPIIFSAEFGNLSDVTYSDDYSNEVNYAYAGGRNVGQSKLIGTAQDTVSQYKSKWNTREIYVNASGAQVSAELENIAKKVLSDMRPRRIFSGKIHSTPATPYGGKGWKFGDRVTVSDSGFQFDAIIRSVHVKVKEDGNEEISANIEGVA